MVTERLAAIADILFPPQCGGCGRRGTWCCRDCAAEVRPPAAQPPPVGVERWFAATDYDGAIRALVVGAKYRNQRAAIGWLGALLARSVAADVGDPIVTWIPTTVARRTRRGYDQAELLARSFATKRGLESKRLLVRADDVAQTGRSAFLRRSAPPCFRVAAGRVPDAVLIVDDVATTGATLSAAACALRRAGVATVTAATVARAHPRAVARP